MDNIRAPLDLMLGIKRNSEEFLPPEHKGLEDGNTVYWDDTSKTVVFASPDKRYLFLQPENGKEYYDALTNMPFPSHETADFSIRMRVSVAALRIMLNMVRETLRILTEEWGEGEFHTRFGLQPVEAENAMRKLQSEIDRHSA